MADYRVRILEIATRDLDRIIGWVAEQSPDGAARLLAAFERLLRVLESSPESFSPSPESEATGYPLRQGFFRTRRGNTHRAVFMIDRREV